MTAPANPHDQFFKYALGQPQAAREFLRHYLPAEISATLDLSEVELVKDSFVDERLRAHFSDLLYKVKLRGGHDAFVYMLFEHKSYPEPQIAFQLLKYMVRIWETTQRWKPGLLPIVPVVVYHGEAAWTTGLDFQWLLTLPPELAPYVPEYRYWLCDLSAYKDEELQGEATFRVALLLLKHIRDGDLAERAPAIVSLLREVSRSQSGMAAIEAVLRYLVTGTDKLSAVDLQRVVSAIFPEGGDEVMLTLAEKWKQEGLQQGRQEGRQEGRQVGLQQGIQTGLLDGIEVSLDIKFGVDGLRLLPEICKIKDIDTLKAVQAALRTVHTTEELRRVYQ